jgi:hypothetical protein
MFLNLSAENISKSEIYISGIATIREHSIPTQPFLLPIAVFLGKIVFISKYPPVKF